MFASCLKMTGLMILCLLIAVTLAGCGSREYYVQCNSQQPQRCVDGKVVAGDQAQCYCKYSTPWPFADNPTLAICPNAEECNLRCDNFRKGK